MRCMGLISRKNIDLDYFESQLRPSKWRILKTEAGNEVQVFGDQTEQDFRLYEMEHDEAAEGYEELEDNPIATDEARYFAIFYTGKALLNEALKWIADHSDVWVDLEDEGIFWSPAYVKTLETSVHQHKVTPSETASLG